METLLDSLKYDANGLIPAIIQDHATGQVLMFAFMNRVSLEKTLQTGKTHFFSRSRNKLWLKGESSGHTQDVKSIQTDCDQDVVLIKVEQHGAACHDGYYSCFYRQRDEKEPEAWKIVGKKVFDPETVYKK
jgi:phosphoribosyl-AMP cyclohydrolase